MKWCAMVRRGETPMFQSEEINKIMPESNTEHLMSKLTDEEKHASCKNQ